MGTRQLEVDPRERMQEQRQPATAAHKSRRGRVYARRCPLPRATAADALPTRSNLVRRRRLGSCGSRICRFGPSAATRSRVDGAGCGRRLTWARRTGRRNRHHQPIPRCPCTLRNSEMALPPSQMQHTA